MKDDDKIHKNVFNLLENTPIIKINNLLINNNIDILVKCENLNPLGTIYSRINNEIIIDLLNNSGLNFDSIISNDTKFMENFNILYNLHMNINKNQLSIANKTSIINDKIEKKLNLNYYKNQKKYYINFSNEIYNQCNGNIDIIFISNEPEGLINGVGHRLKALLPNIQIIGVCITENNTDEMDTIPSTFDRGIVDIWAEVQDSILETFKNEIIKKEGIKCGIKSTSVILSILKYIDNNDKFKNKKIIGILPD